MKKITAILLSLSLLFCLCACGKTEIKSYQDSIEAPELNLAGEAAAEAAAETATETTETETETATALDWTSAYASFDPDTPVFTVNGVAVTWQEVFYEIAYCATYLQLSSGETITDWSALVQDSSGNQVTCEKYVVSSAIALLQQYHIVYKNLTDAGVTLSEAGEAKVAATRQATIDENFDGDEEAFLEYLSNLFCTTELWDWFLTTDALYEQGFTFFYGENGAKLPDADVLSYAEDYNYVTIKQIYLTDPNAEETAASEEPVDAQTLIDTLAATKGTSSAKATAFDKLYKEYNKNADLDAYGTSRCVYQDDVDDIIYLAALALEDYEYTTVTVDGNDILLMRVPTDPDDNVYYDAENDAMYTLRYYAAWQAYSDMINGEDGWLATAETEWVSPFESFSLQDVF